MMWIIDKYDPHEYSFTGVIQVGTEVQLQGQRDADVWDNEGDSIKKGCRKHRSKYLCKVDIGNLDMSR